MIYSKFTKNFNSLVQAYYVLLLDTLLRGWESAIIRNISWNCFFLEHVSYDTSTGISQHPWEKSWHSKKQIAKTTSFLICAGRLEPDSLIILHLFSLSEPAKEHWLSICQNSNAGVVKFLPGWFSGRKDLSLFPKKTIFEQWCITANCKRVETYIRLNYIAKQQKATKRSLFQFANRLILKMYITGKFLFL